MGALHSTNIVSILGSFTRPREWVILMEYCEGGTLRGLLDRAASGKVAFGKEAQAQILLDISYGMRYLHTHNIIHQDLKSLNVLITASGKGKVADFGRSKSDNLSSQQNNNGESEVGSYAWAAPEVIRDNLTSVKADIFSFAIVMWEVMTKRIPWEGLDLSQIVGKVAYEDKRPNLEVGVEGDPDMVKLMEECWSKVPEGRPEFQRIIKILEPLIGSGGRASPVRLESAVPAVASVVPVAPAIPVAFSPAKPPSLEKSGSLGSSKGGRKQLNEIQNLATTLWTKLLTEDASDDCTKKECPFDDDFVAAVELTLLEGEDLTEAQEDFLRKALCKSGAATAQLAQFKKLIMKWKKSPEYADDFIRYLGVAASIDPQSRSRFGSNDSCASTGGTGSRNRFGSNDSSASTGGTGGAVEKEETIDGYWDSGDACSKRGDFQQAFDYYSRACDGYTRLRGPDDENAVKMSSMCASMLHKLGQVGEAIAEYRIALEKKERIPTMGPRFVGS
ncbi:hypothetical protein TrST_g2573 [Triparma strigata]|uniref:Protein kinase domain-containing protein n=1 Tax=Triparma strigata TaxID=1606541 RepID=A0A9W7BW22_9STRA|nr:hypothetical protein TrST_g2573 [Triparma strigata]